MRYDPLTAPDPDEWADLDEGQRISLVRAYHKKARIQLPNAAVHAAIHAVVETQITLGDETPVERTVERLIDEGLDRHDAIHAVGMVLVEHMQGLVQAIVMPAEPNEAYYAALERLTAEEWRRSF
jgi:hypothetical protein